MNALRVALRELVGLFVEDVWYALAILVWIVCCALLFGHLDAGLRGAVLFLGLAAVLLIEVVRCEPRV